MLLAECSTQISNWPTAAVYIAAAIAIAVICWAMFR